MTDLFAYHVAKDQMAYVRRSAGQTKLTRTANHGSLRNSHRVISRLLSVISKVLALDHQRATVASHIQPSTSHQRPTQRK
jgi:hypothetical protein